MPVVASQATDAEAVGGPASSQDSVSLALARAARLRIDANSQHEEFEQALQAVANELPSIAVSIESAKPVWNHLKFNVTGGRFDAVRFSSPLEKPADLIWMFVTSGQVPKWNILPAQGRMGGFGHFLREQDLQFPGVSWPAKNVATIQALRGGKILPGQDYILW
ncbi:MAG TPA: hypothetical protein VKU82_15000, partial [Planctomycetaceae bacterium]|nr:hypothetical protein [Planctomycetaceae bacterium]